MTNKRFQKLCIKSQVIIRIKCDFRMILTPIIGHILHKSIPSTAKKKGVHFHFLWVHEDNLKKCRIRKWNRAWKKYYFIVLQWHIWLSVTLVFYFEKAEAISSIMARFEMWKNIHLKIWIWYGNGTLFC